MSTEDDHVAPFAKTLAELAGGKVHTRLSEQLHALTAAVTDTGKKGTLTLQLTLEPLKKGQTDTLQLTAVTKLVAPEGDASRPVTVFFADREGNLTRNDPNQLALPLRSVGGKDMTA